MDFPTLLSSNDLPNRRAFAAHRAANFSASGLKRQDNDLIVIESSGAAAAFERTFDARFASGENLSIELIP